jgi:hypothetical protein
MVRKALAAAVVPLTACILGGCALASEPLLVALAGAGTTTALGHSINGTAYRTFTAPMSEVRQAAVDAFNRMGIRLETMETLEEGELIIGSAERRIIYVDLEPISSKTTRIKVVAKNGGIFFDSSTATEIVLQAEKVLAGNEEGASFGASRRSSAKNGQPP